MGIFVKYVCSIFLKHLKNVPWNGFPKYIRKSLLKNISIEGARQERNVVNNVQTVQIRLPYIRHKGESLLKLCIRKVKIVQLTSNL